MNVRVLGDRVLVAVEPFTTEVTTPGGIILTKDPDLAKTPTRGIVVQLGEQAHTRPYEVQVGDCVLFSAFVGEAVQDGALEYVILREADILAVVDPLKKETAA